ncbi:P-loop containing nucleoside triphosphate hydrolase protein [Cryphonectria parasitica EP155]|uniref:RNA helicase n=1 Tax=Cryphonectria parasitica (strain ATCC 38755 / EP155) TaxID=660469 RepID=A0A9P4XUR4_CRYP1|nr:P-loop containing nucleoside triphosphate hydrolase protein [Cryphonectria parasitica EP155]KAF3760980.1 P-loop containing nucleoside triphosphate hydrolase protein [Cryphonectria parasitica EP155]
MAGNKKKKSKPAANPARGYATTSVVSKARVEPVDTAPTPSNKTSEATKSNGQPPPNPNDSDKAASTAEKTKKELTPEEFEAQLEESELQLLVEKYAQKSKRDAQRQKQRLDTERRLLRSQAESLNAKKWLPTELMDHILDLIQAEGRFAASNTNSEGATGGKMLSEEDLTIKMWTLQQALQGTGFPEEKVQGALQFVLDISTNISGSNKDSIWGLDEALDWLARECPAGDLPDYDKRGRQGQTPADTPLPSGATTPLLMEPETLQKAKSKKKNGNVTGRSSGTATPRRQIVTYDSDIEPDDLIPAYLDTKTKLFSIQRPQQDAPRKSRKSGQQLQPSSMAGDSADDSETPRLLAKIDRIEKDPLFDAGLAQMQWEPRRIALERDFAENKRLKAEAESSPKPAEEASTKEMEEAASDNEDEEDDEIAREAKRMAAEILAENEDEEDQALADLFAALPTNEVGADGKTSTVMNNSDGTKTTIRDFGKLTGVTPMRVLEEACRSRDSSVKLAYMKVSETAFAHRHLLSIVWAKAQEPLSEQGVAGVEVASSTNKFVFKMAEIATPDEKQSEAFIATTALFLVFGSSAKDEKVSLRLPSQFRDLWAEYAEAKKNEVDAQDRAIVKELRALVRKRRDQEEEDGVLLQGAFRGRNNGRNGADTTDILAEKRVSGGPEYYQGIWQKKISSPKYQTMLQSRMQLPMWHFRQEVVDTVEREQVVIICGETGCGKSTQVPSFLLEHQLSQGKPCKVYCTEPRRISAISLARRVSEELGEGKGEIGTPRSLVGYSIRLEANTSKESRLIYATTGIVMRMLEGSNELREITHLVLDEVHERSIESDFLLIVLKKLLTKRKDLKVVLMSATVDAERFSKFFGGAQVLNVPGRTFPVKVNYLEDAVELTGYTADKRVKERVVGLDDDELDITEPDSSLKPDLLKTLQQYSPRTRNTLSQLNEYEIDFDLIVQLISRIAVDPSYLDYSKAILIFLPGIADIRTLNDMLLGDRFFQTDWLVYPMHSSIASEEQEAAFHIPPPGYRKIVLATNIAETGITIPDVTCVIDTGKHREMRFDERRQLSRLIDTFISRANAKQRRGRAGRVQEGLCFHMFTKYRHDSIISDQQTPEMLRLSLQDLAIRVKICKIGGIEETLSQALDPPAAKNIRRAVDALVDVRALTAAEELTPLGQQLARLPLDVFLGKLVLMGTVFKCLDMAVTVAAILSSKSPFVAPFGQRAQADAIRLAYRRGDSDLLTVYNAYLAWKRVCQSASGNSGQEFQFCRKNFLSPQNLANIEELKGSLLAALADSGFLQLTDEERRSLNRLRHSGGGRRRNQAFFELPRRVNINSENDSITQSVIAWSFYPKLLIRDVPGGKGLRNVSNNQSISLHPTSVNRGHNELRWLSYYHIMQSKAHLNAHETTAAESFAIALLCGDVRADMYSGVLVLDGNRARFAAPDWKTMLVMKVLRSRLREMLTRSFKNPGKLPTAQHEKWLAVWQQIFSQDFGDNKNNTGGVVNSNRAGAA